MVKLIGHMKGNLGKGIGAGIGIGILFIFINKFIPSFAIGLPKLPQQVLGGVFVSMLVAPILEEIFFRGMILSILKSVVKNIWVAIFLQALAFSMFHFFAWTGGYYQSITTSSGAFISAVIFGIIAGVIVKHFDYKASGLVASIIAHGIFNTFMVMGTFLVIAV